MTCQSNALNASIDLANIVSQGAPALGVGGEFGGGAVVKPAPAPAAAPPRQALFLTEAGDTASISVDDIHQGQIGDCFLLSSMGELAMSRPADISGMIRANANGTDTVTLYTDRNGQAPTAFTAAFKPVAITVSDVFAANGVNNGAAQDVAGGCKEIWAQVLEKAVATLDGGYAAISNGGSPVAAMEELTGHAATFASASGVTLAELQGWTRASDLVTFDTASADASLNLVADHAYMFEGLTTSKGATVAQFGNPWGFDQPALVPMSQLGRAFAEVDVGRIA
jgi:hypothetical protein